MPKGGGYVSSMRVVTIRAAENSRQTLVVAILSSFPYFIQEVTPAELVFVKRTPHEI